MQNQTKTPKHKQNQGSEAEVGNNSIKSKSQSKKVTPKHKKDIALRRKTKSSTNDECSEHKPSPKKVQKPKSKGRRKIDPPPKELPVEAAKCKSAPQALLADAEKQNPSKSQSHHQVATVLPRDEVHKEKSIIDRPQKKAKVDLLHDDHAEPVVPTKSRSRKRKVESETLHADDFPPKKRRASSKPRSANVGAQNLEMENDAPAGFISMSQALANAINSARSLADKESSGHTRKKAAPEASDPDHLENMDPRPRLAPKAKRKRPQAPAEGIDESPVEMVTKKPKTTAPVKPKKDAPQLITPNPPENRTSSHRTKPVKDLAKDDNGKRSVVLFFPLVPFDRELFFPSNLRTLNPKKKRKENATAGKTIKTTSTSKVPRVHIYSNKWLITFSLPQNKLQSKGRPRIPLHVKKKLDAQYSACPSDDEPDPIDFLS